MTLVGRALLTRTAPLAISMNIYLLSPATDVRRDRGSPSSNEFKKEALRSGVEDKGRGGCLPHSAMSWCWRRSRQMIGGELERNDKFPPPCLF